MKHGSHTGVITGDLIHSPIQCVYPHIQARPDVDKPLASLTRRAYLEKYADTDTLICATHFPLSQLWPFPQRGRCVPV